MPTKSNNTGGRGGKRPGAGRKKTAVREKYENGNPGGRKLEVLNIPQGEIADIVRRIAGNVKISIQEVPQDDHLSKNQSEGFRCGDNGIFKGVPVTDEQKKLTGIAADIYEKYHADGKYILDGENLTICQSNAETQQLKKTYKKAVVNPLGDWTGGTDVDTGATNRKLGSDMGDSVTGGGLHGKSG